MDNARKKYPPGALVRVSDICRNTKTGEAGILPINRATWYRWVKSGLVPEGRYVTPQTVVWPIEVVLALGSAPSDDPATQAAASARSDRMRKAREQSHPPKRTP